MASPSQRSSPEGPSGRHFHESREEILSTVETDSKKRGNANRCDTTYFSPASSPTAPVAESLLTATAVDAAPSPAVFADALDRVEAAVDWMEAAVDRMEAAVDRMEAAVDRIEAAVDRVEAAVDRVEAALDRIEAAIVAAGPPLEIEAATTPEVVALVFEAAVVDAFLRIPLFEAGRRLCSQMRSNWARRSSTEI